MQQKDFVVEDGYMYYPKKALYKQPLLDHHNWRCSQSCAGGDLLVTHHWSWL